MNKKIVFGILYAIRDINEDQALKDVERDDWRNFCRYINRYGAATIPDALEMEDIRTISYNYLKNAM